MKRLIEMVPNKHNGVTFCMGSYGLYDRSLGAAYLCGSWEAIEKEAKKEGKGKNTCYCRRKVMTACFEKTDFTNPLK